MTLLVLLGTYFLTPTAMAECDGGRCYSEQQIRDCARAVDEVETLRDSRESVIKERDRKAGQLKECRTIRTKSEKLLDEYISRSDRLEDEIDTQTGLQTWYLIGGTAIGSVSTFFLMRGFD